MIDPIDSLAFSMHSNPGVYALLLGSGISRSAKIPTGWEITMELVRKLAAVLNEDYGADPADWYRNKFNKEPDYSELLDGVAKSPAVRQQLLKGYWEPTEAEQEEGAKRPTKAHRAIADLVANGFIKVIITTNFDKLLEMALSDVNVIPTVLSSPDSIDGALPIIHTKCVIVKVHGDYLDTRIKNTPEELAAYDEKFDNLLDKIFDEFGLITCGWSAEWDVALRAAITRAPSRRYAMYWAARGTPGLAAQQLMAHRRAISVQIDGADNFFTAVAEKVSSLVEFSRPHPLSTEVAVASLKRFMAEPKFRIQHEDLILGEVERVTNQLSLEKFPVTSSKLDGEFLTNRVRKYENILSTLLSMAVQGGYWAESQHQAAWIRALQRLTTTQMASGGSVVLLDFQKYPATLAFYVLCLSALEAVRFDFLAKMCDTGITREHKDDVRAVEYLPTGCMVEHHDGAKMLLGMERRHAPLSDWLHDSSRRLFKRLIPNDTLFTYRFDQLEILFALAYAIRSKKDWYWAPVGGYGYRHGNRERIINEIVESLNTLGSASPYISSGLLGNNLETAQNHISKLVDQLGKLHWY